LGDLSRKSRNAMAVGSPKSLSSGSPSSASPSGKSKNKDNAVVQQLAKTKMCAFFERGKCFSDTCKYAHSADELKRAPNLQKTKLCKAFLQGKCKDAENCGFAHGEADLRVTNGIYKTQMCNFFERGYCKKGDRCNHAHGFGDMRPAASVIVEVDEASSPAGSGEASPKTETCQTFGDLPSPGSAPQTPARPAARRKSGQAMSSTKVQRSSLPLAELLDSENTAKIAALPTPTKLVADMAAMTCSPMQNADILAQHAAAVAAATTFQGPGPQLPAPFLLGHESFGVRRSLDPIDMLIPPSPMEQRFDMHSFEALTGAPPGLSPGFVPGLVHGLAWPQVPYPAPIWAAAATEAKPFARPEDLSLPLHTNELGKSLASLDDMVRGLADDLAGFRVGGKHRI